MPTTTQGNVGISKAGSQPGRGTLQSMPGSFSPDVSTGAVRASFPLALTPSRALTPSLSLDYHSNQGNSTFGMGFDLSGILSISRSTKFGVPLYDDSKDIFVLSNAGELVMIEKRGDVVMYRPRLDSQFSIIEHHLEAGKNYWVIREANGVNHYLGEDTTSQLVDGQRIFEWSISHSIDAYGNRVNYQYEKDAREASQSFYLKKIEYGNYKGDKDFAFCCELDYGEADAVQKDTHGNAIWKKAAADRPDQFTQHRAGFAVTTRQLCRHILLYHCFDGSKCLVKYWQLTYNSPKSISLIQQIQEVGCRSNAAQQYITKALPPASFDYADFSKDSVTMSPMNLQNKLPGLRGTYQWVDLYREGLPGILYSDEASSWYWRSEGKGQFSAPLPLAQFPNNMELGVPTHCRIMRLGEDQQTAFVVAIDEQAGYYLLDEQQTATKGDQYQLKLDAYQPFARYPLEFNDPTNDVMDLSASGQSDLVVLNTQYPYFYPADSKEGYKPAQLLDIPTDFPRSDLDANALVTFTDIFGDGLLHRVKVSQDGIDIWANLGYGKFGKRIHWNLPAIDGTFDPHRVFLVDIDGTGADDFVYVSSNEIHVYFNNGSGFSTATINLTLPEKYSHQDQLLFGNFLGLATQQVVFIKSDMNENRYYSGVFTEYKPHLLTSMTHALGVKTKFTYASSLDVYLEDRKDPGNAKAPRLPFVLSILKSTTVSDPITHVTVTETYGYHDGHYDFAERQFCGFGYVEKTRHEIIESLAASSSPSVLDAKTKYWFHQGAAINCLALGLFDPFDLKLALDIDKNYYKTQEGVFPNLPIDPSHKEALYTLRGRLLRQEILGTDLSAVPLSVELHNYTIRCDSLPTAVQHGVFVLQPRETLQLLYEKQTEPRITHQVNLSFDKHNNPLSSVEISYGRKPIGDLTLADGLSLNQSTADKLNPLQAITQALYHKMTYAVGASGDFQFLDVIAEQQSFDVSVAMVSVSPKHFDDIKAITGIAVNLTLMQHKRLYYWDEQQSNPLAGTFGKSPLLHHQEDLLGSDAKTDEWYQPVFLSAKKPAMLTSNGYISETSTNNWWRPGQVMVYHGADQYYQLSEMINYPDYDIVVNPSLFHRTVIVRDHYSLATIQVIKYLNHTLFFTTTMTIDYQSMQAYQTIDHNQNSVLKMYDPLGMMIAMTEYGQLQGQWVGNPLIESPAGQGMTSSELIELSFALSQALVVVSSLDDITQHAAKYLDKWLQVHYYCFDQSDSAKPCFSVELIQQNYAKQPLPILPGNLPSQISVAVKYFDSLGRPIQVKRFTDDGVWLSSGVGIYTRSGKLLQQSLPAKTATASYEPISGDVTKELRNQYDEALRLVHQYLPDGTQRQMIRRAWYQVVYDQNAMIKDAYAYSTTVIFKSGANRAVGHLKIRSDIPASDSQKYLLSSSQFDVFGRLILQQDPRLTLPNLQVIYDLLGRVVSRNSVDRGVETYLYNHADTLSRRHLGDWLHRYDHDSWQRVLTSAVGLVTQGEASNVLVEIRAYGDTLGNPANTNSCGELVRLTNEDGVYRWDLFDLNGRCLQHARDIFLPTMVANIEAVLAEDIAPHPHSVAVSAPDPKWTQETFHFAAQYNALGEVVAKNLPDGRLVKRDYNRLHQLSGVQSGADQASLKDIASGMTYQESGFRDHLKLGSCLSTDYGYDPLIQRLKSIKTTGLAGVVLQKLEYLFDPIGNTVEIQSGELQLDLGAGRSMKVGSKDAKYGYDSLYRLTSATGQELVADPVKRDWHYVPHQFFSAFQAGVSLPLKEYQQTFGYDQGNNLTSIHCGSVDSWQLDMSIDTQNNRFAHLTTKDNTLLPVNPLLYDKVGNMQQLDAATHLTWGHTNQLRQVVTTLAPEDDGSAGALAATSMPVKEYYGYKGSAFQEVPFTDESGADKKAVNAYVPGFFGQSAAASTRLPFNPKPLAQYATRLYKISCFGKPDGSLEVVEQVFLGDYSRKRIFEIATAGSINTLIRHTVDIKDEEQHFATSHRWELDVGGREAPASVLAAAAAVEQWQYHLNDHLHSALVDVDEQGHVLSLEAYQSYGQIAFIVATDSKQMALKQYHYSGETRDKVTGLYYYGARYYAPQFGRWIAPDPAGLVDGANLYGFVGESPIGFWDEEGFKFSDKVDPDSKKKKEWDSYIALGVQIAKEELANPYPNDRLVDHLGQAKTVSGTQNHGDDKLNTLLTKVFSDKEEISGKKFSRGYRDVWMHRDEQFNTANMRDLLRGIEYHFRGQTDKIEIKKAIDRVSAGVHFNSLLRPLTTVAGSIKDDSSTQHSLGGQTNGVYEGSKTYPNSYEAHEQRSEIILKAMAATTEKGADKFIISFHAAISGSYSSGLFTGTLDLQRLDKGKELARSPTQYEMASVKMIEDLSCIATGSNTGPSKKTKANSGESRRNNFNPSNNFNHSSPFSGGASDSSLGKRK